jgi:hypothetical protein
MIAAGSVDGLLSLWDSETGDDIVDEVAPLSFCRYGSTLYDVGWHPAEHMMALCSFGGPYPLQVRVTNEHSFNT